MVDFGLLVKGVDVDVLEDGGFAVDEGDAPRHRHQVPPGLELDFHDFAAKGFRILPGIASALALGQNLRGLATLAKQCEKRLEIPGQFGDFPLKRLVLGLQALKLLAQALIGCGQPAVCLLQVIYIALQGGYVSLNCRSCTLKIRYSRSQIIALCLQRGDVGPDGRIRIG